MAGGNGRLHVRLVALFSLIAAAPTLLVVIFASLRNGEDEARIPLALGGLMCEGTAEDVAPQHDDFMVKARAMGIEPPLDPIMGIIFLPLPVIPTLRIRPEGMFDVTTFTYAD